MTLNNVFLIAIVVTFSACATARYETYYVALDPNNSENLAQASATCVSQATNASNVARASEQASQTSGGGFATGLLQGMNVGLAARNARETTMRSCMNAFGFTEKRVCVSGC